MRRRKPPHWRWLLAHELRLMWRGSGAVRSKWLAALGILIVLLFHLPAYAMLRAIDLDAALARAPLAAIIPTVFGALLLLSAAFGISVVALFERGDLDLLAASPVAMADVLVVRGVAVALGSTSTLALLLLPFANAGAARGRWAMLATYPVLFALGLAAAAIAFACTFGWVRLLGLRRARVAAQVMGALVGAGFIIALQFESFLPASTRAQVRQWLRSDAVAPWLGIESPLAWPVRAMLGHPLPLLAVIIACIGLFAVVVRYFAPAFLAAIGETLEAPAPRSTAHGLRDGRPFVAGLSAVMLVKELRLIARDRALIGRVLLQMLFLVPLMLLLLRKSQPPAVVAAALVLLASSLAGTFAWITVGGEESPDLLGSAPVSARRVLWMKLAAALVPVALVCVPFVVGFAVLAPDVLALMLPFLAAALVSSAMVQIWTTTPGGKRDLRVRYKDNFLVGLAEQLATFGWAAACFGVLTGHRAAWAGIAVGMLAPLVALAAGWSKRRER